MWPTWKENKLFTVLLTFFMIVTICFVVQKTESLKRPVPQEHQISIEGVGKATGKPDIATISFGVVSKAADVATAQTANTTSTTTLLDQTKAQGISEDDIQTSNYSVGEDTGWDDATNQQTHLGWIVAQTVTVKVRDTSKVGALLTALGQNGATDISGPTFTIDDLTNLKAEARAEAIKDAQTQAAAIAKSLGLHLRRIVGYSEWSDATPMPYSSKSFLSDSMLSSFAPVTIETGTNEVSMNVSVTYSLERW